MVDKSTARALVYGAIGVLAVLVLVAVVALSSKRSMQAELDAQVKTLKDRELKLLQEEIKAKDAIGVLKVKERRVTEELKQQQKAEEKKKQASDELDKEVLAKEEVKKEAKNLRKEHRGVKRQEEKRAHNEAPSFGPETDEEKDYAEYLATLSDEELEKQLNDETAEFEKQRADLGEEHLQGADAADLKKEMDQAHELMAQATKIKSMNMKGAKEAAEAYERLQELGEQNEVSLEDLQRDVKQKGGKGWKEGSRPAVMKKLVKQMDTRAEVLRHRGEKKRLQESEGKLKNVQDLAHLTHDAPFEKQVKAVTEELQSEEKREERLMDQGDDEQALKQAQALEEYARTVQEQVEELERAVKGKAMSTDEKKEHDEVLRLLEQELVNVEGAATAIEQGYERRQMRLNTVEFSKQGNELQSEQETKKLKHRTPVYQRVEGMLNTEANLLVAMKEHNVTGQEELAQDLEQENKQIEEDAQLLRDEAESHKYGTLQEQLDAERVANELRRNADQMLNTALLIEHEDERRRLLEEARKLGSAANNIQKLRPKLADEAKGVKEDAKKIAAAVAGENWDEEFEFAKKAHVDIVELERGAADLEKDLRNPSTKYTQQERIDMEDAVKEMLGQAKSLRKELKKLSLEVRKKAGAEVQRLERERKKLNPVVQQ